MRDVTPELLGIAQAATMLGIGLTKFKSMAASGQLGPKPLKFGRRRLYRRRELIAWVDQQCPRREKWLEMQAAGQSVTSTNSISSGGSA